MKTNREYKEKAKELTSYNKGKLALIFFIYFIITVAISFIGIRFVKDTDTGKLISIEGGTLGDIISFIVTGPFSISFVHISKQVYNQRESEVKDLFSGFKDGKSILIYLLEGLFIFLWTLLFIIPGIIMSFAYSMAYYVHNDEPYLKPIECLQKSKLLMQGHKAELFELYLSYIGHYILALLTLGIYGFWLTPRVNEATYLFYLDIKAAAGLNEDSDNSEPYSNDEYADERVDAK